MSERQPILRDCNLDDVVYYCPCGESLRDNESDYKTALSWLRAHAEHCNGMVSDWITDDGMRVLSKDSKRKHTWDLASYFAIYEGR